MLRSKRQTTPRRPPPTHRRRSDTDRESSIWRRRLPCMHWAAAVAFIAVLVVIVSSGSAVQAQTPDTSMRFEILEAVHDAAGIVTVTVLTDRPELVDSLTATVDDEPAVVRTSRGAVAPLPLALVIVIDASDAQLLASARVEAAALLGALKPGDQAAVVSYGTGTIVAAALTTDMDLVEAAIASVERSPGSDLYGGIERAASVLAMAPAGARAIVLYTTGWHWGPADASIRGASIEAASAAQASVYPIALRQNYDTAYLSALAQPGETAIRPIDRAAELLDVVGETEPVEQVVTLEIEVPTLSIGSHSISLQTLTGGERVQAAFDVTNEGLLGTFTVIPADPAQTVRLMVEGTGELGLVSLAAVARGQPLAVSEAGWVQIDPWEFAPGNLTVQLSASVADGLAWSGTADVQVPELPPELTTRLQDSEAGQQLFVSWRAQPLSDMQLVVRVGATTLVSTSEQSTQLVVPAGEEVLVTVERADGVAVVSKVLQTPSVGSLVMPTMVLAGGAALVIVALLAAGVSIWRQRLQQEVREPDAEVDPGLGTQDPFPTPDAAPAYLVVRRHSAFVERVRLTKRPLSIGASPQCGLQLKGDGVRFVHAIVVWEADDEYRIHCFGPVEADGRQVAPDDGLAPEATRRVGEAFEIAAYRLTIVSVDDAAGTATPRHAFSGSHAA